MCLQGERDVPTAFGGSDMPVKGSERLVCVCSIWAWLGQAGGGR